MNGRREESGSEAKRGSWFPATASKAPKEGRTSGAPCADGVCRMQVPAPSGQAPPKGETEATRLTSACLDKGLARPEKPLKGLTTPGSGSEAGG